jgi:hypothetical protein
VAFVLGAFSVLWMLGGLFLLVLKALAREECSASSKGLDFP